MKQKIQGPIVPQSVSRFLSKEACFRLVQDVKSLSVGGGEAGTSLESQWAGNLRWARNRITSSGDLRMHDVVVQRMHDGATGQVTLNQIDRTNLEAAVRRAEWILSRHHVNPEADLQRTLTVLRTVHTEPKIWSEQTFQLNGEQRADTAHTLLVPVINSGLSAAGYIQVSAQSRAVMDSLGLALYYPYTKAQYSVTVRNPGQSGSGWAGQDRYDWQSLDVVHLTDVAIEKCKQSANPVAVEPGRYTAILEPQAVGDLFGSLFDTTLAGIRIPAMDRKANESPLFKENVPFYREPGRSKIGEQLLDSRITITADPMDPELGFPPFGRSGEIYRTAIWFEKGILRNLAYARDYAIKILNQESELPDSGAFHMSGESASVEDMIRTTKRGLLVTRFSNMQLVHPPSWLVTGFTRDGLWLIENGKITKSVKNFRFTESPLFVFNQVEQLGRPQRIFHPEAPVVVPPAKVRDFSFTSLADAV